MLPTIPDYERTFPVQVQINQATYTASLTVSISLYLEGLPLTSWDGSLNASLADEKDQFKTAGEAMETQERLIVKVISELRRAGYIEEDTDEGK